MIKLISSDMMVLFLTAIVRLPRSMSKRSKELRKMVSILLSTQDVNIQMHAVLWKQPD